MLSTLNVAGGRPFQTESKVRQKPVNTVVFSWYLVHRDLSDGVGKY